ncbi:MAG TPA: YdiU family protein, partial [Clostridia bacterium]|nr:YdiU family protein [Clostridia bacterium]
MKASTHGWALENSYLELPEQFYSRQEPTPVKSPKLIICNNQAAAGLGLEFNYLTSAEGVAILSGNIKPPNAAPIAQAYAGHQFGYFTMLGDGRALLLGEQLTPSGERVDIQLKGSGRTPYSRGGDGRAALGPMLREYIISEAMHALNIPTTRSLAVVATGEPVYRETTLKGAVLTRLAKSHIRVGTFEFAAFMLGIDALKKLADYTIARHFPGLLSDNRPYLALLREVVNRQALLISKWQLAGFIHGVMNTDNMSICGETIDYGPCAFMDEYDPKTVFSSIDTYGRYAYHNQPKIAQWNLARFAETILPLLNNDVENAKAEAEAELSRFDELFNEYWLRGMRLKLGLANEETGDKALVELLLELMQKYRADYTNTFLSL